MYQKTAFLFLFILLYLFNTKVSIANPPDDKTLITVIGTVHYSTNNYNSDTLLAILNKINPDVILVECDSSYMTSDFELKDDIKNSFLETKAITRYAHTKRVDLRPYDISDRDLFLNDYNRKINESNFFEEVDQLSQKEKLNSSAINILNGILSMMNIAQEMAYARALYINTSEGSKKIDTINYYSYVGLTDLIKITPELSQYKKYWDDENKFWQKRNNVMLDNIFKFIQHYSGKKIVILCGFGHKNILKNGLIKKAANEKLIVKEYWEF